MKIAVFSSKLYDREFLSAAAGSSHEPVFFEPRLNAETAPLAAGFLGVCAFVNDQLDRAVLTTLARGGTKLVALRCAGFNQVDLAAADEFGLTVVRVPAYSPHAVAEHTVGLILALNRKLHRAYARVREGNFTLDGLLGFDMAGRTAGVVGTGKIGALTARILCGFGCTVIAHDVAPNPDCTALGIKYVALDELFRQSDIISLHCPLMPATHHLINAETLSTMRDGVMLINTSRGQVIDTRAIIAALKSGKVGYLGLDVYEEEADLFFENLSNRIINDDVFSRLQTFPNVLITGHQAFFTREALANIAETTIANITAFERGEVLVNSVSAKQVRK